MINSSSTAAINASTRATQRSIALSSRTAFQKSGLRNALSGSYEGIYNHKAKWAGYTAGGIPKVEAYGTEYQISQVHGYKGIPKGTPVTLRTSKNFMTVDFQ